MVRLSKESLAALPRLALRRKPLLFALSTGGGVAFILTVALLAGWTAQVDRWAFDLRQRLFARDAHDGLVIVGVDTPTGDGSIDPNGTRPELLQEFIERVRDAGASVIVLDISLDAPGGDPAADSALARVLAAKEDIVLAARVGSTQPADDRTTAIPAQEALLPPPLLSESASGVGIILTRFDPDSVVRRAQVQSHVLGVPYWSLMVEALRVYRGVSLNDVRLAGDVLEIGDHRIDTGRDYYIDHRHARPPFSLQNLMRGSTLPTRAQPLFENAVVLVSPNLMAEDAVTTSLHSSVPSVFTQASEFATLVDGPIRQDAPTALQLLLIWVLALGGACVFFLGSAGTGISIWAIGWGALLILFSAPFAAGMVFGVAGPTLAWGLIFPIAIGYRLHVSRVDVLARDRSIAAIARLRDIRFEDFRLVETLTPLLESLGGALDAQAVLLLQEGGEFWEVVGGIGAPPQDWKQLRRAAAQTNGQPVLDPSAREAFVPIVVDQDDRRRVLYVRASRNLGPLDTHTLHSVASGLHLGFHNRALVRSLEDAYLGILATISVALEARDQGTEAHCQRLAAYSCALALELGYDDDFLEDLWVGATLHDIGKVGIPDAVFLKPGKLTRAEYETMKQHTVLGYQILENAPISDTAKLCVLHHHERWDGSGYPHGLAGEKIPRGARIVAVVDMFDGLTSDRAYRRGKPEPQAVEYLQKEAGSALEPELVESFLELHQNDVIRGACHPIPETVRRAWRPRHERGALIRQIRPPVGASVD